MAKGLSNFKAKGNIKGTVLLFLSPISSMLSKVYITEGIRSEIEIKLFSKSKR